jgi:CHAT domain-containing protein/Tfp pilus assembly protein PilF
MRRGRLDEALHEVETACTKYRASAEWAARCHVQKAHVLFLRGSYNDALALLATDLPAPLAHAEVAVQRKMVQGLAYAYLQEYDQAEASLTEAETLERSVDSSFRGDVSLARGILETDLKRYVEANIAFRRALTIARERNLPFLEAQAFGNIGYVAMRQERYDEAIDWFRLTLQKSRSIGSLSSSLRTLGNMGWNYAAVGDFENAEASLKEARAKAEEAGLIDEQIYWLNSLADVYARQHRYAEADSAARQAVLLAEKNDDKDTLTTCLNTRSEIAIAMGHLDDAEKSNRRATEIENAGLDHFGINRSRLIAGRIEAGKHENRKAEALFRKVLADPKAETPLKWEAHARLAQVYAGQHQPAKAEREFNVAIGTVEKARNSVQRDEFKVSFLTSAIEFYDDYVNFLIEQKRSLEALKIADLSRTQSLDQSLSSASVRPSGPTPSSNFQDAARRLNATLLYYWLGQEKSWLWAITPTETFLIPLPASPEIDSTLKPYRDSFTGPRDPLEAGNADGKKLYTTLIQPVEKIIPKNSRVVILPDGSLNSLNFETLIVSGSKLEDKPHYWIEDVTITTANSLVLLARSSVSGPPSPGRLLVVGDALSASPDFPPLPQAGKEVGLLENYFSPSQRLELTGANATATHFLSSEPEKFSYLHFATHGTASRTRPLESAVILSPEGDSFKLYARDVVKHPLNAYLVTISACNGAGTKSYAGEGLVGLSWAFLRAGAHNVIAGLWEVSNASTPQLMDELYKGIHAGEDPATALRNAKLTLVHSSGNYRKPFYWAPFVLYAGS